MIFEALHEIILCRSPIPFIDLMVSELLAEKIRLKSQTGKGILFTPHTSVLIVPSKPPSNNQKKPYSKVDMDECSYYKRKGHQKAQCPNFNRIMQQ